MWIPVELPEVGLTESELKIGRYGLPKNEREKDALATQMKVTAG